jgi:hypothetical protein
MIERSIIRLQARRWPLRSTALIIAVASAKIFSWPLLRGEVAAATGPCELCKTASRARIYRAIKQAAD